MQKDPRSSPPKTGLGGIMQSAIDAYRNAATVATGSAPESTLDLSRLPKQVDQFGRPRAFTDSAIFEEQQQLQESTVQPRPLPSQLLYEQLTKDIPAFGEALSYGDFMDAVSDKDARRAMYLQLSKDIPTLGEALSFDDFSETVSSTGPTINPQGEAPTSQLSLFQRMKLDPRQQVQMGPPSPAQELGIGLPGGALDKKKEAKQKQGRQLGEFLSSEEYSKAIADRENVDQVTFSQQRLAEEEEKKKKEAQQKQLQNQQIATQRANAEQPQQTVFEMLAADGAPMVSMDADYMLFQAPVEAMGDAELLRIIEANKQVIANTYVPAPQRNLARERAYLAQRVLDTRTPLRTGDFGELPMPERRGDFVIYYDPNSQTSRSMTFDQWIKPIEMASPDGTRFTAAPYMVYDNLIMTYDDMAADQAAESGVMRNETNARWYDRVASKVNQLTRGAVDLVPSTLKAAGIAGTYLDRAIGGGDAKPEDDPVYQAGEQLQGWLNRNLLIYQYENTTFGGQLARALGQALPMLATYGAAAPTLGRAGAARFASTMGGVTGGSVMGSYGYEDAISSLVAQRGGEENLTDEDYDAALSVGMINMGIGAADSFASAKLLGSMGRNFRRWTGGAMFSPRSNLKTSARSFFRNLYSNPIVVSASTEFAQSAASNFTARQLIDAEREVVTSESFQEGLIGATTSGIILLATLGRAKLNRIVSFRKRAAAAGIQPGTEEAIRFAQEQNLESDVATATDADIEALENMVAQGELEQNRDASIMQERVEGIPEIPLSEMPGPESDIEVKETATTDATREADALIDLAATENEAAQMRIEELEEVLARPPDRMAPQELEQYKQAYYKRLLERDGIEEGTPEAEALASKIGINREVQEAKQDTPQAPSDPEEGLLMTGRGAEVERVKAADERTRLADELQNETVGTDVVQEIPQEGEIVDLETEATPDGNLFQYAIATIREIAAKPTVETKATPAQFVARLKKDAPILRLDNGRVLDIRAVKSKQLQAYLKPLFDQAFELVKQRRADLMLHQRPPNEAEAVAAQREIEETLDLTPDTVGINKLKKALAFKERAALEAEKQGRRSQQAIMKEIGTYIRGVLKDANPVAVDEKKNLSTQARKFFRMMRDITSPTTLDQAAAVIDKIEQAIENEGVAAQLEEAKKAYNRLRKIKKAQKAGRSLRALARDLERISPAKLRGISGDDTYALLQQYKEHADYLTDAIEGKKPIKKGLNQEVAEFVEAQKGAIRGTEEARIARGFNAVRDMFDPEQIDEARAQYESYYLHGTPIDPSLYRGFDELAAEQQAAIPEDGDAPKTPRQVALEETQSMILEGQQGLREIDLSTLTETQAESVRALLEIDPLSIQSLSSARLINNTIGEIVSFGDFTNGQRVRYQAVGAKRARELAAFLGQENSATSFATDAVRGITKVAQDFKSFNQRYYAIMASEKAAVRIRSLFEEFIIMPQQRAKNAATDAMRRFQDMFEKLPEGKVDPSLAERVRQGSLVNPDLPTEITQRQVSVRKVGIALQLLQRFDGTAEQQLSDMLYNRRLVEASIERKLASQDEGVVAEGLVDRAAYETFAETSDLPSQMDTETQREAILGRLTKEERQIAKFFIDLYAKRKQAYFDLTEMIDGAYRPEVMDFVQRTYMDIGIGEATTPALDFADPAKNFSPNELNKVATGSIFARKSNAKLPDGRALDFDVSNLLNRHYYQYELFLEGAEGRNILSGMLDPKNMTDGGVAVRGLESNMGTYQYHFMVNDLFSAVLSADNTRVFSSNTGSFIELYGLVRALATALQPAKQYAPNMVDAGVQISSRYGMAGMKYFASVTSRLFSGSTQVYNVENRIQPNTRRGSDGEFLVQLLEGMRKAGASTANRSQMDITFTGSSVARQTGGLLFDAGNREAVKQRRRTYLSNNQSILRTALTKVQKGATGYMSGLLDWTVGKPDRMIAWQTWTTTYVMELVRRGKLESAGQFNPQDHLISAVESGLLTQRELSEIVSAAENMVARVSNESNTMLQSALHRLTYRGEESAVRESGKIIRAGRGVEITVRGLVGTSIRFTSMAMNLYGRQLQAVDNVARSLRSGNQQFIVESTTELAGAVLQTTIFHSVVLANALIFANEPLRDLYGSMLALLGVPQEEPEMAEEQKEAIAEFRYNKAMESFFARYVSDLGLGPFGNLGKDILISGDWTPWQSGKDPLGEELPQWVRLFGDSTGPIDKALKGIGTFFPYGSIALESAASTSRILEKALEGDANRTEYIVSGLSLAATLLPSDLQRVIDKESREQIRRMEEGNPRVDMEAIYPELKDAMTIWSYNQAKEISKLPPLKQLDALDAIETSLATGIGFRVGAENNKERDRIIDGYMSQLNRQVGLFNVFPTEAEKDFYRNAKVERFSREPAQEVKAVKRMLPEAKKQYQEMVIGKGGTLPQGVTDGDIILRLYAFGAISTAATEMLIYEDSEFMRKWRETELPAYLEIRRKIEAGRQTSANQAIDAGAMLKAAPDQALRKEVLNLTRLIQKEKGVVNEED